MQVILLQDVSNVGKKYEEVEVADGYGTNYLIPNGLAQVANEATRNRYQKLQEKAAAERQKQREKLAQAVEDLDGGEVVISVDRAGDQGQLFAGIYPEDIAAAVNEEFGVEITGADVDREQPISKVGEEKIDVSILDTTVTLKVVVEADSQASDSVSTKDEEAEEPEVEEAPAEVTTNEEG